MAVTAAQRQSAQLHLRRWQSQRRQSLLRFAQAQSKSVLALLKRLASKPEPSQCPEQRHLAGCRMAVAHRKSNQLRPCSSWVPYGSHSGAVAIGAAGRGCAAVGAVALAPVAVTAADVQRHWLHCTCQPIVSRISCDLALAGCRMAVTAAQRQSALLHLRRWQ